MFTLRQLAEIYSEFSKYLYVCYVDFQQAFDSVWHIGLWRAMRFLGYEDKLVRLLEALYKHTMSAVRVDGDLSQWCETVVGVMQGCMRDSTHPCIIVQHITGSGNNPCIRKQWHWCNHFRNPYLKPPVCG